MKEIDLQGQEIAVKTVKEVENEIRKPEGISSIIERWKDQFLPIGTVLLLIIMALAMLNMEHEISQLQNKISKLSSDNASLSDQLEAQAKQIFPAKKSTDNKGTDELLSYVVQAGDCFENISERYYQTADYASDLARLNGLTINSTLQIGQIIKVPKEAEKLNEKRGP